MVLKIACNYQKEIIRKHLCLEKLVFVHRDSLHRKTKYFRKTKERNPKEGFVFEISDFKVLTCQMSLFSQKLRDLWAAQTRVLKNNILNCASLFASNSTQTADTHRCMVASVAMESYIGTK